ncbi:MAG: lysophospholipid acyltransferase family protein [Verrucomicrobia bacterium]|nr:lysophospholipid acyltransferase family protein [Verrucomicrobiota bacterium]
MFEERRVMPGADSSSKPPDHKPPSESRGIVVPHKPRWFQRIGAWAVYILIEAVGATQRFRFEDHSGLFEGASHSPAIFCIWHNRLALSLIINRKFVKQRSHSRRLAALVSASKDGGFLARVLELFGAQPVRGSSSRRGAQALLELTTWAQRGYDLAITPDGPRGPRYVVQDGVIALAELTGLPIVPATCQFGWKWRLKSWDRFQVPLPFSRCEVKFAEPIRVPRDVSAEERESLRLLLEDRLKSLVGD